MKKSIFSGRVCYANGQPVPQVRVRVLDRDAPGKKDDDLTIEEGLSNENGRFTVIFSPSKYLDTREISIKLPKMLPFDWASETRTWKLPDFSDVYLPFLQFSYTVNGRPRKNMAFLRPFKNEFRLPELPLVQFTPSLHGLKFVNRFKGYFIPFSIPALPSIPSVSNIYGLCGGMIATSLDFALARRKVPPNRKVPRRKTSLHKYIYRRQIDSFGSFGAQVVRFVRWMLIPDSAPHGVWKKSLDEFGSISSSLDDGNPLPIGLVYVSSRDTLEVWKNHQVLAYGYKKYDDQRLEIQIYDPNHPLRDDVRIKSEFVLIEKEDPLAPPVFGIKSEQWIGDRKKKNVRGFFAMPYTPVIPPPEL